MIRVNDLEFSIAMKLAANRCLAAEVEEFMKQDTETTVIPHNVEKRVSRRICFEKWKNVRTLTVKTVKIASVLIMCLTTLFFITTMSISPVRAAFIDAIVTWYEDYIDVRYRNYESEAKTVSDAETDVAFTPMKPTYIPEGWGIISEFKNAAMYSCDISDSGAGNILFSQYKDTSSGTGIDNDNCVEEKIYIKNDTVEANLFIVSDNEYILIWNDGYMFMLQTENIELDELLMIAESVNN